MLQLFRNYQKYIYLVVTVVIIISFSFFGTYSTMNTGPQREAMIVFTAIDGQGVSRKEVEALAQFLATDAEDKLMVGGGWGPNFFNDGVIKNDFLKTGL